LFRKKPGGGDVKIVGNGRQIGRLCVSAGYAALNNGQRQFVPECLAPQHGFELQFTTQQRVIAGN
jgi:hypothetical protein